MKRTIKLKNPCKICSTYSVVGGKEHNGPLGDYYDEYCSDNRFGKSSWEKAESEMQRRAFAGAIKKSGYTADDIDLVLAGDLLNQCVGSTYGLQDFKIPYIGLYGACSTCALSLGLGAVLCSNKTVNLCGAVTSSAFCSSERQFRFPLEYGGQRTPTAQWTVTGAGAFLLGNEGKSEICEVQFGEIVNMGIKDINNMGAAMAPAAIKTIFDYFNYSTLSPSDFDLIVTGDLGYEGSEILKDLLLGKGIDIRKNHIDCGLTVFDRINQDVHAGGSGCGCSAVVLASNIVPNIENGVLKDVLFIGTGALMSPMTIFQGESIPAIAHLLHIRRAT